MQRLDEPTAAGPHEMARPASIATIVPAGSFFLFSTHLREREISTSMGCGIRRLGESLTGSRRPSLFVCPGMCSRSRSSRGPSLRRTSIRNKGHGLGAQKTRFLEQGRDHLDLVAKDLREAVRFAGHLDSGRPAPSFFNRGARSPVDRAAGRSPNEAAFQAGYRLNAPSRPRDLRCTKWDAKAS